MVSWRFQAVIHLDGMGIGTFRNLRGLPLLGNSMSWQFGCVMIGLQRSVSFKNEVEGSAREP